MTPRKLHTAAVLSFITCALVSLGHLHHGLWYVPLVVLGPWTIAGLLDWHNDLAHDHAPWKLTFAFLAPTAILVAIGSQVTFIAHALALPPGLCALFSLHRWLRQTPSYEPDYEALRRPKAPLGPRPPLAPRPPPPDPTRCEGCGRPLGPRDTLGVCAYCYGEHIMSDQ